MITFKSFTNEVMPLNKFANVTFSHYVYGFGGTRSVFNLRSEKADDYVVIVNMSSFITIPLIVNYSNDIKLEDLVDPRQKIIELDCIGNDYLDVDLTGLKTKDAMIMFFSGWKINSLKMNDYSENANVKKIVFMSCKFGNGTFQFNSKFVKFSGEISYQYPNITFNENCEIDIIAKYAKNLVNCYKGIFPLTRIHHDYSLNFDITDKNISFGTSLIVPTINFQELIVYMNLNNNNDINVKININTPSKVINNNITLAFEGENNKDIYITFKNLRSLETVNNIGIDFGYFGVENIINLGYYPIKKFFTFKGNYNLESIEIIDNSRFCACKESTCDLCEENIIQVSYYDLNQKIKDYDETKDVYIYITAANDNSIPLLSFDAINDKNAVIYGIGTNPKVQIDCSKSLIDYYNCISFINISIFHSKGENFQVSNLKINSNCKIDLAFKDDSLNVNSLRCHVNHIAFKSIFCNRIFDLSEKLANIDSETKISFGYSAKFYFNLPDVIIFKGPIMKIDKFEFNLTYSSPKFFKTGDFQIIGEKFE